MAGKGKEPAIRSSFGSKKSNSKLQQSGSSAQPQPSSSLSGTQGSSSVASQSGPHGDSSGANGNPYGSSVYANATDDKTLNSSRVFSGTAGNASGSSYYWTDQKTIKSSLGASSSANHGISSQGFAQGNSVNESSSFQQYSPYNKQSANPHSSFGQLHAPPKHSSTASAEVKALKDEVKILSRLIEEEKAAVRKLKTEKDTADRLNRGLNRSKTMVKVYENYRRQSEDRSYRPLGTKKYDSSELGDAVNNPNKQFTGMTRYGAVYKSTLDQKIVVIEILNSKSQQDFNQKVDILTRLQHPNLVSYIGAYEKKCALICEHLPGDTLQDRLVNKSHTAPFSWEQRVGIAASICSTLLFLHNTKFSPIIHGDLKAENICFDADNVCRLSIFGLSRSTQHTNTSKIIVPLIQSDICAFGIVLLQLVTGQEEKDSVRKKVLKMGDANQFLEWQREMLTSKQIVDGRLDNCPTKDAVKMLLLGLRCSHAEENQRPDIATEVWTQIQSMKIGAAENRVRGIFGRSK